MVVVPVFSVPICRKIVRPDADPGIWLTLAALSVGHWETSMQGLRLANVAWVTGRPIGAHRDIRYYFIVIEMTRRRHRTAAECAGGRITDGTDAIGVAREAPRHGVAGPNSVRKCPGQARIPALSVTNRSEAGSKLLQDVHFR